MHVPLSFSFFIFLRWISNISQVFKPENRWIIAQLISGEIIFGMGTFHGTKNNTLSREISLIRSGWFPGRGHGDIRARLFLSLYSWDESQTHRRKISPQITRNPIVFDTREDMPSRIIDEHTVFHLLMHPEAIFSLVRGVKYTSVFPACFFALSRGRFEHLSSLGPRSSFRDSDMDHRSSHSSEHTSFSGMS